VTAPAKMQPVDLLVRADRVVSPDLGLDGPGAVAVRGDRIVASGPEALSLGGSAHRIVDLGPVVLLPGLVDLHAHPDRRTDGSKYGVDPDVEFLRRGVTTLLSQGDAGAGDWTAWADTTLVTSRTRMRMALNLSVRGEAMAGPALEAESDVDVEACARIAAANPGTIWGIAVNTSRPVTGANDPRRVLRQAIEAAERADVPLLFGSRRETDVPLDEQLALLRPGDVVTYCYSGTPENILVDGTSEVRDSVREARARGILFDIGHGMASYDFRIAESALAAGFPPDTISTDQYRRHVGSVPQHDLARTISKVIASGMPEVAAFAAATSRAAAALGLASQAGTLAPGASADLCALRWNEHAAPLVDTEGGTRPGGCWEPVFVARAGEIVVTPA
jgi:dihydroorotase